MTAQANCRIPGLGSNKIGGGNEYFPGRTLPQFLSHHWYLAVGSDADPVLPRTEDARQVV